MLISHNILLRMAIPNPPLQLLHLLSVPQLPQLLAHALIITDPDLEGIGFGHRPRQLEMVFCGRPGEEHLLADCLTHYEKFLDADVGV